MGLGMSTQETLRWGQQVQQSARRKGDRRLCEPSPRGGDGKGPLLERLTQDVASQGIPRHAQLVAWRGCELGKGACKARVGGAFVSWTSPAAWPAAPDLLRRRWSARSPNKCPCPARRANLLQRVLPSAFLDSRWGARGAQRSPADLNAQLITSGRLRVVPHGTLKAAVHGSGAHRGARRRRRRAGAWAGAPRVQRPAQAGGMAASGRTGCLGRAGLAGASLHCNHQLNARVSRVLHLAKMRIQRAAEALDVLATERRGLYV